MTICFHLLKKAFPQQLKLWGRQLSGRVQKEMGLLAETSCFPVGTICWSAFQGYEHLCAMLVASEQKNNVAVGQHCWYHFGIGEFTTHFRTDFSGD